MFSYYDADGNTYPDRLAALQSNKRCYWRFPYEGHIMWEKEPTQTLQTLYKERAQYIRDTYEWVTIAYSGGIDSTNVLESFYYNNIHIDEILVFGALSQDRANKSDENHNGELYHNVFPTLNQMMNLPKTKITIYDYAKELHRLKDLPLIKTYGNDWAFHVGGMKSLHNLYWNDVPNIINQKDKATAIVFGADKPWVYVDANKNKFYTCASDTALVDYGGLGDERVNFYTDPHGTATRIWRKQAHIIKNYARATYDNNFNKPAVFEKLIYDLKHPLIFTAPKSRQAMISLRDRFITRYSDTEQYKMFEEGVVRHLNALPPEVREKYKKKLIPFTTGSYYLE
jgi:hypothetical protein